MANARQRFDFHFSYFVSLSRSEFEPQVKNARDEIKLLIEIPPLLCLSFHCKQKSEESACLLCPSQREGFESAIIPLESACTRDYEV